MQDQTQASFTFLGDCLDQDTMSIFSFHPIDAPEEAVEVSLIFSKPDVSRSISFNEQDFEAASKSNDDKSLIEKRGRDKDDDQASRKRPRVHAEPTIVETDERRAARNKLWKQSVKKSLFTSVSKVRDENAKALNERIRLLRETQRHYYSLHPL